MIDGDHGRYIGTWFVIKLFSYNWTIDNKII